MKKLVPDDFHVPEHLETERCHLKVLTVHDVVLDYDAVMTSIDHLRKTQPFGPEHRWPAVDLTLEQDLIDLGWHQKEFQRRTSFAYTVLSTDKARCLGCLYIYPSSNPDYDACIIMWVRQSEAESGLDAYLFSLVKRWMEESWPFEQPGYPGREISWEQMIE